jgi:hypothetical protein
MVGMLESWNDGPTKSAITDFVGRVTEEGRPDYVESATLTAIRLHGRRRAGVGDS